VDFDADPVPVVTYKVGGILFTKTIMMVPDTDQVLIKYELLEAPSKLTLSLKPFLAFRSVHGLTSQNPEAYTGYEEVDGGVAFRLYSGFPYLNMQLSGKPTFKYQPYWYSGVTYSDEYRRGFDCREDLFVPGAFSIEMNPGDSVVFSASVEEVNPRGLKRKFTDTLKKMEPAENYEELLAHNAEIFKCHYNGKSRINAGFSWLETGLLRETIASLPGLTLYANGDCEEFEKILDTLIADENERLFHRTTQCEAPLRLTETIQQYIRFSGKERQIWKKYGETLKGIIESYAPGRRKEIAMHPNGLLWAQMDGVALSWMNAYVYGNPVTERAGYQVETNAYWYNALCFAIDMENKYGPKKDNAFVARWTPVRDMVKENYQPMFWREEWGYLVDFVGNGPVSQAVRPNMLIPAYLEYCPVDDEVISEIVMTINDELLTRRGLRSLSPRNEAYRGVYEGSQIDRDLAYHQGCAFPDLLAPYIDLCFRMMGSTFYGRAKYLVEGFFEDISKHGVGQFSELYDGDPPHEPHGAIASAMSTAALLHIVYVMKQYKKEDK
jgi:predicted glycogen debranching enzyme